MKRDLDLIREIMLAIEERYQPGEGTMFGLQIEGYDLPTVAEHCNLLYQQEFITDYRAERGDDVIQFFSVGNLSSAGYDYLEQIRDEKTWQSFKKRMKEKQLPQTVGIVTKIAAIFFTQVIEEMSS